jgi:UDPglucose 6-dehydrogenase
MANICVAGLWHQGSVLSGCFADMGHQVCGVDENGSVVSSLNRGIPFVYEPGLGEILRRNLDASRLRFATNYAEGLANAQFAYISIDTPVNAEDESDLEPIFDAVRKIGKSCSGELVVIITAQVPVGTCEEVEKTLKQANPRADFHVAYVPEFLRLGIAVESFRLMDRIVIGARDSKVFERIANLYEPLQRPIVKTDLRTAEMAKHASNVFLATSISFINEIASLCEESGADVLQVSEILKLDRRIGKYAFLSPGLGFAGGTLGREIRALQKIAKQSALETPMMDAVMAVNRSRVYLVEKRLKRIYGSLKGLQIGIWGLTYKAGTSTTRRSVALEIIRSLIDQGAAVKAFDPLVRVEEIPKFPSFDLVSEPRTVALNSDALVLMTEWNEIRGLDFSSLPSIMRKPVFIDTRNLFDPDEMAKVGFMYFGIGRTNAVPVEDALTGS